MTRVRSMLLGHPLRDWTHCSAQQQPPCFGRLYFSDGTGVHIDVTALACWMGRADESCSQLMAALGDCSSCQIGGSAAGLHFRCAADPWGLNDQQQQMMMMIPAMHIDSHPSIAKCHAYLRWNFKLGDFQVLAVSPVGIYLNGLKILPEHGPQLLPSRSILQMGSRIMFFVRPRKHSPECTQRPVEQRQALLSSIAELVTLRQPMRHHHHHHPQAADKNQTAQTAEHHHHHHLLRSDDSGGVEVEMQQGNPVNWDPAQHEHLPSSSSRHDEHLPSPSSPSPPSSAGGGGGGHHHHEEQESRLLRGIALLLEASAKRSDDRS